MFNWPSHGYDTDNWPQCPHKSEKIPPVNHLKADVLRMEEES